jgi:uncharacterized protein DUF6010
MHPAPLALMDYIGPALGALLFVAVMSLVAEPTRRTLNAIILVGASGVYPSSGFALWEWIYPSSARRDLTTPARSIPSQMTSQKGRKDPARRDRTPRLS